MNYGIDIASVEALMMYDTQIATSKVIVGASGGSLAFTSVILLIFYIKNYIDSHGKELGILKALGYSEISIACRLWVFALSVFVGTSLGYAVASVYMPRLYELQNNLSLFPEFSPKFHFEVLVILVILPTVFFALISIFYAFVKLKMPAVNMLKGIEKQPKKVKKVKVDDFSFLKDMKRNTLRSRKILAFFAGFSAFCFSAMLQMSASMGEYASDEMGFIVLLIGLTLAFVTLYLSLSSVVKANQKTIAMMTEQNERLSRMVKTLLDMSELQTVGRDEKIAVDALIDEVLADLEPLAQEKNIKLAGKCKNTTMVGSDILIYRLVYNLVENAIKYNHSGGQVTVTAYQKEKHVYLSVEDTGNGIPEELRERVFEPFFRVDKSRSRELGGVGLGLALVHEIVRVHDGSITVKSSPSGGTIFDVIF